MKKFNATKMMALLMALCLITSTFVGSTLAKYTTEATGEDTARVAKFGVEITANGTTFADTYATDNGDVKGTIANSVIGLNGTDAAKVIAPGTAGEMVECVLAGTPEVAVTVAYDAELTLAGWEAKGTGDATASYYCPLEITVNGTTFKGLDYATETDPVKAFTDAVEGAIEAYTANYAPNTNLATETTVATPDVSWAWAFEGNDDVKDTYLGDQAATATAATVELSVKTTVTQID